MQKAMSYSGIPRFVQRYVRHFEAAGDEAVRRLAEDLGPRAQVLEVGAGGERHAGWFSGHGYVGVEAGCGEAEWKGGRPEVIAGLTSLPFRGECFDACLSAGTLEHVPAPGGALREMARALRPRGRLLLIAPQEWEVHQAPQDYFRFTRYGLRYLLEQAGFTEIRILSVGGFFRLLARRLLNALRFFPGLWSVPAAVVLAPPALLLPAFDWLDRDRNFTLGYICTARKR